MTKRTRKPEKSSTHNKRPAFPKDIKLVPGEFFSKPSSFLKDLIDRTPPFEDLKRAVYFLNKSSDTLSKASRIDLNQWITSFVTRYSNFEEGKWVQADVDPKADIAYWQQVAIISPLSRDGKLHWEAGLERPAGYLLNFITHLAHARIPATVAYKQSDCKFYKESVTYAIKSHQALCEVTSLSVKLKLLKQCVRSVLSRSGYAFFLYDQYRRTFPGLEFYFLNAREHYPFLMESLFENIRAGNTDDLIRLAETVPAASDDFTQENNFSPLPLLMHLPQAQQKKIEFLFRSSINYATVLFLLLLSINIGKETDIFRSILCSPFSALIQWGLSVGLQNIYGFELQNTSSHYFLSSLLIEDRRQNDFNSYLNYLKHNASVEHIFNFPDLVKTLTFDKLSFSPYRNVRLGVEYAIECQEIGKRFCLLLLGIGSLLSEFFPRGLIDLMSDYVSPAGSPTIFLKGCRDIKCQDTACKDTYRLFIYSESSEDKAPAAHAAFLGV
jgi:hypothetical protein